MLNKLMVFALATLFSCTASAGLVQYNLSGGPVQGFFVQDDSNKAILYYDFRVTAGSPGQIRFFPSGGFDNLTAASTNFYGQGPTNFSAFDNLTDAYYATINLSFQGSAVPDVFSMGGSYSWFPVVQFPGAASGNTGITGFATAGSVQDAMLLAALNNGPIDGINNIIPASRVPEPASGALFAVGALAFGWTRKRRQAARILAA